MSGQRGQPLFQYPEGHWSHFYDGRQLIIATSPEAAQAWFQYPEGHWSHFYTGWNTAGQRQNLHEFQYPKGIGLVGQMVC